MDRKHRIGSGVVMLASVALAVASARAADLSSDGKLPLKSDAAHAVIGESSAAPESSASSLQSLTIESRGLGKFGEPFVGPADEIGPETFEEGDAEAGIRAVGETCADPIVIPGLPYTNSQDTRSFVNDYTSPNCNDDTAEARDVVYSFTPVADVVVTISFCQTNDAGTGHDDSRVWVYQGSCLGANEISCNDDSPTNCAGSTGRSRQAEIPALLLAGGQTYYIIADGWNGFNGVYTMEVREVGPGACCDLVGGQTCTPNVGALTCQCLTQKFSENAQGGNCTTPSCISNPVGANCPDGSIFGPGFHDDDATSTFFILGADDSFGTSMADAFWSVNQPISFISWWAVYSTGSAACDKADSFTVTFYANDESNGCQPDGARPGDVIAGPFDVTPARLGSGFNFGGTSEIFRFTAQLPVSVSIPTGWVGVAAKVDPNAPDCNCYTPVYAQVAATTFTGDKRTWWRGSGAGGGDILIFGDMLMCMTPPTDPGACCNDSGGGSCLESQTPAQCPPPGRFLENGTCASLSPECGMGACCTLDGNCAVTDEAGCTGTWKGGVSCAFANCPPSNDTCSLVVPATGGLPYAFTNRTNGATDDDCEGLGSPAGWHAFVLDDTNTADADAYSCYDVVVDYCGTSPAFTGTPSGSLMDGCCTIFDHLDAVATTTTARAGTCCRDDPPGYEGNFSVSFNGVRSGDWYYPVLSVGGAQGDYSLNVTGGAASAANVGDSNGDGRKNLSDYAVFRSCISGVNVAISADGCECLIDADWDNDVDLRDYAAFQAARDACTSCSGTAENEAACSGANEGCDAAGSPVFTNLALVCGTPLNICGTASTDDSDWYQVSIAANSTLSWTVTAEFPVTIELRDGTLGCDGAVLATADSAACAAANVSFCVIPGTYWLTVRPQAGAEVVCGSTYAATAICTAGCTPTTDRGPCCANGGACTPNVLETTCLASPSHKYVGDGSSCVTCSTLAANNECNTSIVTLNPAAATTSGSVTFNRSQLTSNVTDPVSGCELDAGGPFAVDGSIWFRYRAPGAAVQATARLQLSMCCQNGAPAGDALIILYQRSGENNVPATSCANIIAAGDGQETACDDDSCAIGADSPELCLVGAPNMNPNTDYYILVKIFDSGQAVEQEVFTLNWNRGWGGTTPACPAPAPLNCVACATPVTCPGASRENEPDNCSVDHYDYYNSGCNALNNVPPGTEAFGVTINCGETVTGTAGYYNTNGGDIADRRRDTDWYLLQLTEGTVVTWSVNSQTDGAQALLIDVDDCNNTVIIDSAADLVNNDPQATCGAQTVSAAVPAGRYAVFASFLDPSDGAGTGTDESVLCPQDYCATLTCQRDEMLATPTDLCNNGTPTLTGPGSYLGMFGNTVTQAPNGESTCDGEINPAAICDGSPSENDTYWKYTAPCTGKVSFEIRSGPAVMVLSAHSACPATCDNELPGGLGSGCTSFGGLQSNLPKLTLDAKAGTTYVIRLAGDNAGAYELLVSDCTLCCDPNPLNCPFCGNGTVEGAEECDDGNANNGDACDNFCRSN